MIIIIIPWSCDQTSPERISSSKCSATTIWPINGHYLWKESNLWMVFQPQHMVGSWETILWVRERRNTKGWVHTAQHNGLLEFPSLTRTLWLEKLWHLLPWELSKQYLSGCCSRCTASHIQPRPLQQPPVWLLEVCVCVWRGLVVGRNFVHSFTFTCNFPLFFWCSLWCESGVYREVAEPLTLAVRRWLEREFLMKSKGEDVWTLPPHSGRLALTRRGVLVQEPSSHSPVWPITLTPI